MPRRETSLGLCVLLLGVGCASIVEFPEDPELVAQAALEAAPAWQCSTQPPETPSATPISARVRARACDALRGCSAPVTELRARVCSKIDVDCSSPLLEDLQAVDGVFEFDVPMTSAGFAGYLEVSSSAEPCTSPTFGEASPLVCSLAPHCNPEAADDSCDVPIYPRFLHFFNPPITEDVAEPVILRLLPMAGMLGILGATGGSFDATNGILIVTARDCDGGPLAGIRFELDQAQLPVTQVYMADGVLSRASDATDASGIGGFVGVARGYSNIVAYTESGERMGGVGVQIAPASITNVTLTPSF
jgi:hypothetical protein